MNIVCFMTPTVWKDHDNRLDKIELRPLGKSLRVAMKVDGYEFKGELRNPDQPSYYIKVYQFDDTKLYFDVPENVKNDDYYVPLYYHDIEIVIEEV